MTPAVDEFLAPFLGEELVDGLDCGQRESAQGVAVEVADVGIADVEATAEVGQGIAGVKCQGVVAGWSHGVSLNVHPDLRESQGVG